MIGNGSNIPTGLGGHLESNPALEEAVTKLKIEQIESQDVVLRFGLEHNL
jgi:hypothetical protein